MMKGAVTPEAAAALVPDGASVMIGGFMGVGTPERMIDALVARGVRGLTVIANDTAMPGRGYRKAGLGGGSGAAGHLAYRAEPGNAGAHDRRQHRR